MVERREKPEHLTADEYLGWFWRERHRQERALELPTRKAAWGSMPTPESLEVAHATREALAEMKADPVALRNHAARDGITITD